MASQPWIPDQLPVEQFTTQDIQWSHDLSAMDTPTSPPAATRRPCSFNGTTASQPWIRRRPIRRYSSCRTFNGAMASQPWIRQRKSLTLHTSPVLQWSHGLPAMDTGKSVIRTGGKGEPFNGAMASQPWIHVQRPEPDHSAGPSMEPRPLSHGYGGTSSPR